MQTTMIEEEKLYLSMVMKVLEAQHQDNVKLMENASQNVSSLNRELWEEVGPVSIANGLDQISEFMSYIHQVNQNQRSHAFIEQMDYKYKLLLNSPYFGRLDFTEHTSGWPVKEPIYIGLGTLINEDHDFLVYDWRAPISSLYYDYELGEAHYQCPEGLVRGQIDLKRQFKIKEGQLQYVFDASVTIEDEILMDLLGQSTNDRMKQIVNSIQKEQNAIIRSDDKKHLIVEGPAGSGKTSVALHRIAYLLYKYKDTLKNDELLIFSPNEVFTDYISDVLPQLGETSVNQITMTQLLHRFIRTEKHKETYLGMMEKVNRYKGHKFMRQRLKDIRRKSSLSFIQEIEGLALDQASFIPAFQDVYYKDNRIMSKAELETIYESFSDLPRLLHRFEKTKERALFLMTTDQRMSPSVVAQLEAFFELDALTLYLKAFALAPEDTVLRYEDQSDYLYFLHCLGGLKASDKMKYVIIDEAQDYSPVQMKLLHDLFCNAHFTLTGDPQQSINPSIVAQNYRSATSVFADEEVTRLALTKTYRSTDEINTLARSVLKLPQDQHSIRRMGQGPEILAFESVHALHQGLADRLRPYTKSHYRTIAIITRTIQETNQVFDKLKATYEVCKITSDDDLYKPGILVMPLFLAKGLEFDVVFLHNVSDQHYSNDEGHHLYTACTRALHELILLHEGNKTHLL